jgi:hypothetical protein
MKRQKQVAFYQVLDCLIIDDDVNETELALWSLYTRELSAELILRNDIFFCDHAKK